MIKTLSGGVSGVARVNADTYLLLIAREATAALVVDIVLRGLAARSSVAWTRPRSLVWLRLHHHARNNNSNRSKSRL